MATTNDSPTNVTSLQWDDSRGAGYELTTDYLLLLSTDLIRVNLDRHWRGLCRGTYKLISRDGRSRQVRINHPRERIHDEGEYLTLLAGVSDLTRRIKTSGREPGTYTLTIVSGRELVVRQLAGVYMVKSPVLRPHFLQARGMIDQFAGVEVAWRPSVLLKKELG